MERSGFKPVASMLVRGDSSDPEFQMADQPAPDQFDDWSANRDRQLLASQSYQHVSRDIYGADDLDAYGNWVPSQYGDVWEPRSLSADWAPYSTGQWVWEGYYGWTWVDDAPWGWAPYHYGRWFRNPGYGWCWWPGSIGSSYFWSPALVGFFGWGGGGISVGLGGIGWVALAPFEIVPSVVGTRILWRKVWSWVRELHEHKYRTQHQHHEYISQRQQ